MNEHGFPCPKCGSADIRRSRRQGFSEMPGMLLGIYPFRCLKCGQRFLGNVWLLANKGYVHCPRCLRLDVAACIKSDVHIRTRDRIMLAFGAHRYRCTACRLTFSSFGQAFPNRKPDSNIQPNGNTV